MKKILLLLCLFITYNSILAQQTRFFIQSEVTMGNVLDDSRFESNEYFGYISTKTLDTSLQRHRGNWSYGIGFKSGIFLNNYFSVYTGIRYRKLMDETVFYCITCNYILTETTRLETDFLEIPFGFRFNILGNSRLQPYLSSEVFWAKDFSNRGSKLFGSDSAKNFDLFRIAYKAGAAYKIGVNRNWEISLQSGLNTNLGKQKSYPRYHFREVTAEVGVLRAF